GQHRPSFDARLPRLGGRAGPPARRRRNRVRRAARRRVLRRRRCGVRSRRHSQRDGRDRWWEGLPRRLCRARDRTSGAADAARQHRASVLGTGLKTPNLNYTGPTFADEIRLNLAIAPTAPVGNGNRLGVLGGDLAGYPNGRRLEDDVVDISERAVGGVLIGHSLPLGDGVDANDVPYMTTFPYQADPFSGYDNTKGQQKP